MSKILVTGGGGYVGYSLVSALLTTRTVEEVTIYDNLSSANLNSFIGSPHLGKEKLRFIQGDILDNHSLEKSVKGQDCVIHLAAKASTPFADNNSHEFDQVNNWGTGNVVQAIEKSPSVSKFIHLSSISVYGNTGGGVVTEDSITSPKSFYGISKLKGERHVSRLSGKMETFIYRTGNVFGYNPCIRLNAVINRFMFDAQYKNKIEIHGNGNQKRAFTNVDCIGKFIANQFDSTELSPGLYNLVNYNLSVKEIADRVVNVYPNIDIMYVDQHLEMRSISAISNYNISFDDCFKNFDDHLIHLKNKFSF